MARSLLLEAVFRPQPISKDLLKREKSAESQLVRMSEDNFRILNTKIEEDRSKFWEVYNTVKNRESYLKYAGMKGVEYFYSMLKDMAGCYPTDNMMQAGVKRTIKLYPELKQNK